jgi:hypothetical protein
VRCTPFGVLSVPDVQQIVTQSFGSGDQAARCAASPPRAAYLSGAAAIRESSPITPSGSSPEDPNAPTHRSVGIRPASEAISAAAARCPIRLAVRNA